MNLNEIAENNQPKMDQFGDFEIYPNHRLQFIKLIEFACDLFILYYVSLKL